MSALLPCEAIHVEAMLLMAVREILAVLYFPETGRKLSPDGYRIRWLLIDPENTEFSIIVGTFEIEVTKSREAPHLCFHRITCASIV